MSAQYSQIKDDDVSPHPPSPSPTLTESELDIFLASLHESMPLYLPTNQLLDIAHELTTSFQDGLQTSTAAMLPSHIYYLPTGREIGTFLSVDLGGSTLRVALVKLSGLDAEMDKTRPPMEILQMKSWGGADIEQLKKLRGDAFFDWIALRIAEVTGPLSQVGKALPMGLSWSFPIEQTSIASGNLQGMGKGFVVADELLGTDLKMHFMGAFQRQNLNIVLKAMVNDTVAALLSHAYTAPATRVSLIVGTGVNAAVQLPVSSLPDYKLPKIASSTRRPQNILLNTEISMFGKGILPVTTWDEKLNAAMERPDFQPLEYLVSGRYLGEILRLIATEDALKRGLFHGVAPVAWQQRFGLETSLLAGLEDGSVTPEIFASRVSSSSIPHSHELASLQRIVKHISTRAATYCAVSIFALYQLREWSNPSDLPPATATDNIAPIAFTGTVMERYPQLRERTQEVLDRMVGWTPTTTDKRRLVLQFSQESAIYGAAVAVAAAISPVDDFMSERASNASTVVGSTITTKAPYTDTTKPAAVVSKSMYEISPVKSSKESSPAPVKSSKKGPWRWVLDFFSRIFAKLRAKHT